MFETALQKKLGQTPMDYLVSKIQNGSSISSIEYLFDIVSAEIAMKNHCVCKGFAYYHTKAQEKIIAMKKHTVHNKLVRDRIPEIIADSGRICITEVLPDSIGELPESEMQEIGILEELPENLTYPQTSPVLYKEAEKLLKSLVRFELATEDDAKTIIELRQQIWTTTYRGFYPDSMIDDFDYAWHLEKELQRIRHPEYRVYRIVKKDCDIGYLTTRKTDVVMLQSLYILEEHQHQGIGRMAFDFVKQYCRENGTDAFICHCLPENWNARKFYEKMGGTIAGEDMDNEESWMNSVIYRFVV